ncbi:MAG: SlyX protein [Alcanivorax sp.]|nr:SlyX protein [Alcanivorax sp.]
MDDDRLVDIETKLAYQEDLVQALNGVVARQQQQIDQLEKACRSLIEHLNSMSDVVKTLQRPEDEIPPHY